MSTEPPSSTPRAPRAAAPISIEEALQRGTVFLREAGVESARLDTELILAEATGLDRLGLYMNLARRLTGPERQTSREMLDRRRRREPIAYIRGRREFYGLDFDVDRRVLIPRPETEFLVDAALSWLRESDAAAERVLTDIGTGSGAIAIAAARAMIDEGLPGRWIATDDSEEALQVARANAGRHGVEDRIEFRAGSLFDPLGGAPVDLICCNPPYIAMRDAGSLAPEVREWEPGGALFSGEDGLDCLRALIAGAPGHLKEGGRIFIEIGFDQAGAVSDLIGGTEGLELIAIDPDGAGIGRVVKARRT